jgi:glutathione S-transferase
VIELIQFPWSPFCLVQHRILDFAGVRFKTVNIPNTDRSLVWRLTRQRYYQVPILKDGGRALFETDEHSQVLAKYLDWKLGLGLFPREWEGVQSLLWRHIENEIEGYTFKLNDVYYREFLPAAERLNFIRHKERKFGRGCLDRWQAQQKELVSGLTQALLPFEEMLDGKPFLLGEQPRFVDFDLLGMLDNFLYSGHYALPRAHSRLRRWHRRITKSKHPVVPSEKLRS